MSAQETNLASVGGTEDDPTEVTPGEVLGYVSQGMDIFSSVLGPIVASQGGELQGLGQSSVAPQAAGVMTVTSDNQPGEQAVVVASLEVPWVPIGIGVALLAGLIAVVAVSR